MTTIEEKKREIDDTSKNIIDDGLDTKCGHCGIKNPTDNHLQSHFYMDSLKKSFDEHFPTLFICCDAECKKEVWNFITQSLDQNNKEWIEKVKGLSGIKTSKDTPFWKGWNAAIKQINDAIDNLLTGEK